MICPYLNDDKRYTLPPEMSEPFRTNVGRADSGIAVQQHDKSLASTTDVIKG